MKTPGTLVILQSIAVVFCLTAALAAAQPKTNVEHRVLTCGKGQMAIVGADGKIEWQYKTGGLHDLQMLPSGNILFQRGTRIVEVNRDKQIVWSYDSSKMNGNAGRRIEVHSFQRLPGGITMIAESGIGRIIEVDRQGKIVHQIKLKVEHPSPHRDTRLVRKLASGGYLVCHEGDGAVREYARDGKVVWEYRVPLFGKQPANGHGPEAFGNQAFCALRLPDGDTLIATGNGHSVIRVTKDKKIVWHLTQKELPDITLAWVTTLEFLPNGNIVLGNCHAGPNNPQLVEITKDKKVVWTFHHFAAFGNSMSNSQILGVKGAVIR